MFNPLETLGWEFRKKKSDKKVKAPYVQPHNDDAAFVVGTSSYSYASHHLSLDQTFDSENDLIRKYREMSLHPEVDNAIVDIVNEAIDGTNESAPVEIVLDDLEQTTRIKNIITEEFDNILKLLDFNNESYEIFRKWYVDGKIHYHIIINENSSKNGIEELRYISPLHIKKIREEKKGIGEGGVEIIEEIDEYFVYTPEIHKSKSVGIKLTTDSVCYVTSGLIDEENNKVYSYLHKAIKPTNQLRMMEDAIIIYRLSRAPERRVFYIDVGNLPKNKAEEYLRGVMNKYKNKMVYDAITGEVKDHKNTLSMMEDFWLPRREGGRGTEISTLDGGQNLGQLEDIDHFQKKLYQSLSVPYSRIAGDDAAGFNLGRSSEITRDEVKYSKFIARLRKKFSMIFVELLKTQLILKKIITADEWDEIEEQISFNFLSDTFFAEMKEAEMLRERIGTLAEMREYIGTYFSMEWARKNILQMTDEDITEMKKQIEKEQKEEPEMIAKFQNMLGNDGMDGFGADTFAMGTETLGSPEAQQPAPVRSKEDDEEDKKKKQEKDE